jgi:hypothetical protein
MSWKESYNDICSELRIVQIHEMEIRRRVDIAHGVLFSGKMASTGNYCHIPLDKGIEKYNAAVSELEIVQAEVERLNSVKIEMEKHMAQFEGLANVVMYKRIMENKTNKQVAMELGYSESHIRNVLSKKYKDSTESAKAS